MACWSFKSRTKLKAETAFIRYGGHLLEESISFSAANCNPMRCFSAKEIEKATENYNHRLYIAEDSSFILYRGLLRDRLVMIKKYKDDGFCNVLKDPFCNAFKDAVFSSVFSAQKNIVKLLGCCLEAEFPILVLEHAENGTLENCIFGTKNINQFLPWKFRMKIAMDLCNAVAYLHNAFPKPVVHRDIHLRSIFLDKNNAAKLSDFSLSIAIPDGKDKIEGAVIGKCGYGAPEYIETGRFDEKIDVYHVGVVLLQLLTRKRMLSGEIDGKYYPNLGILVAENLERDTLNEVVDIEIQGEEWPGKEQQLEDFARIALLCLSKVGDRPTIIEVVKQLSEIYRSLALPVAL